MRNPKDAKMPIFGGSDTEKAVFEKQKIERMEKKLAEAKQKRTRGMVFLALVGGLIYFATRK